ncbi:MAG: hypothetical protein QG567_790 [Campylobacterota bacterium]|nr:hypothetical protein [Campylobacterota bacterium]MDQ1339637.1 hypothetical protein [Campylobacterota bacterium]
MNQSIGLELESVLSELQRLSEVVAKKERELNKVKDIYLTQVGSESFELVVNDQIFTLEKNDLEVLIEQIKELGLLNKNKIH